MLGWKKWLASFAGVLCVFSFSSLPAEATVYPDVPASHWSAKEVTYLSERGVLKGGTNGRFNKDAPVTRAQAAAILVRAKELSMANVPDPGFQDVPKSHPFYKEIATAVHAGWFSTAQSFNPDGQLTRAEMAKITANAFDLQGTASADWEDMGKAHWSTPFVERIVANGVTSGYTATKYRPAGVVTRAQFAVFIARGLDPAYRLTVAVYPKKAAEDIFYPQFRDTSGQKDFQYLNEYYVNEGEEMEDTKKELTELAKEDPERGHLYTYEASYRVARADRSYISIVFDHYYYTGGAHGYTSLSSQNYDVRNAFFMLLGDLATKADYERKVIDRINTQGAYLQKQGRGDWSHLYSLGGYQRQFYMTNDGFVVYFNPYQQGSYAAGIWEFKLPYSLIR